MITVRITKGAGWYKDKVGEVYEVVNYHGCYVVAEDHAQGIYVDWRYIEREDCTRVDAEELPME